MQTVRLCLVTDIHAGTERSNIRSTLAIPLLDEVVESANRCDVDLLATLGDNVNATNVEEDRLWLDKVRQSLARCKAPAVPLFGNNEVKFLTPEQAGDALGCSPHSEVRIIGGWTLIFWRPNCSLTLERGYRLDPDDLAWLEATLADATHPAVLFLHVLIDGHSMRGNFYFANCAAYSTYANAPAARAILEASGKVVLVMTGHVHWNAGSTIAGIHYRSLASLTDTLQAPPADPSATWGLLELGQDGWLSLEVFGREPMRWSAPARTEQSHWKAPLTRDGYKERMRGLWSGRRV
jgi:hypothetical protein